MTKDEKKDEMKNRISMALKDPILQQGFEIICREFADLEQRLEQTEKDLADYQFNYPTIKELAQENAELKNELAKWKDEWQEQVQKAIDEGYARTQQTIHLTKAKEHIRTLISCLIDWVQEGDKDYCYIADAEQFLKEIDK